MQSTIAALLADKRNTRLALATALAERNAEVQALRAERNATPAPAPKAKPVSRVVPTREPRPLPAHFIAARELAMRTGKCIRVGA